MTAPPPPGATPPTGAAPPAPRVVPTMPTTLAAPSAALGMALREAVPRPGAAWGRAEPLRPLLTPRDAAAPPTAPAVPLTPMALFVYTYEGTLSNLRVPVDELTARVAARLQATANAEEGIGAVNSNYGHYAQPGYERYLKLPGQRRAPRRPPPAGRRPRKLQGDGTCFNSAIEPVMVTDHPGIPATRDKVYLVKCFSTTGKTQVPGGLLPDFGDARSVLRRWVGVLNALGAGEADPDGRPRAVEIESEGPNMLNFKFQVALAPPNMLIRLSALSAYFGALETFRYHAGSVRREAELLRALPPGADLVIPPYRIAEVAGGQLDVKFSCRFLGAGGKTRLNIFQEGKVNILGAKSYEAAGEIYRFLYDLFARCWGVFVSARLQPDRARRPPRDAGAAPPAAPPAYAVPPELALSDAELDALLAGLGLGEPGEGEG